MKMLPQYLLFRSLLLPFLPHELNRFLHISNPNLFALGADIMWLFFFFAAKYKTRVHLAEVVFSLPQPSTPCEYRWRKRSENTDGRWEYVE